MTTLTFSKRCAGCCDCAAYEVSVEAPPGNIVGYVKQTGSFWKAKYEIQNEQHDAILKLQGPCCIFDGKEDFRKIKISYFITL